MLFGHPKWCDTSSLRSLVWLFEKNLSSSLRSLVWLIVWSFEKNVAGCINFQTFGSLYLARYANNDCSSSLGEPGSRVRQQDIAKQPVPLAPLAHCLSMNSTNCIFFSSKRVALIPAYESQEGREANGHCLRLCQFVSNKLSSIQAGCQLCTCVVVA